MRCGLLLLTGGALRSARTKCFAIFLLARSAVMGHSGKEFCKCVSFWIRCQCVCINLVSWGSQGVYVVMKGGVLSLFFGLSSNVLGRSVNGMCVLLIMFLGNFLFCRCSLCVFTVLL